MDATEKQKLLSRIPPVNQILEHPDMQTCIQKYSRSFVLSLLQKETERFKRELLEKIDTDSSREDIQQTLVEAVLSRLQHTTGPRLKRVINATGIILHTGLGRAPLTDAARENLTTIAEGYCSLEIDLETGARGDRTAHVEDLLCELSGAEAACVVNNNAAAVLLTLNTLCFEKEAIISRGQLIEIGGSFRIPDVMQKSGVKMVEVGTTNKTHLRDYEKAISERAGLICVVHPSNYRVKGFTAEPELADVVQLAQKHDIPVFQDLGGGVLLDLRRYALPYEPVARESVETGVDVISFSGDKVLGGPQCGIIVGKRFYIDKIKANPLMRALRCDKLIYAALEPTLKLYFEEANLPKRNRVLAMLLESPENLQARAQKLLKNMSQQARRSLQPQIEDTVVQIGSGALPLEELPSKALSLHATTMSIHELARQFRACDPAIVGYIRDDKLFFDLRTIAPSEEQFVLDALEQIGAHA